jgi:hypothetical protein
MPLCSETSENVIADVTHLHMAPQELCFPHHHPYRKAADALLACEATQQQLFGSRTSYDENIRDVMTYTKT